MIQTILKLPKNHKTYYITSDPHGFYYVLKNFIDSCGFKADNNNVLIIDGDLFDRGTHPWELYQLIKPMVENGQCILVLGNHDADFIDLANGYFRLRNVQNGTVDTMSILSKYSSQIIAAFPEILRTEPHVQEIKRFLNKYCYMAVEFDDYIVTHGWIPKNYPNNEYADWYESMWINTPEIAAASPQYNKMLVVGHWYTGWWLSSTHDCKASDSLYYGKNFIAIDSCVAATNKLNLFIINN
jgi:calcineurin-like phosphoesterase family protein